MAEKADFSKCGAACKATPFYPRLHQMQLVTRCDNLSFHLPWLCLPCCLGIIPAEEGGLRYVKECGGHVNRGSLLNRGRAKKSTHMPPCHGRKSAVFQWGSICHSWKTHGCAATAGTSWRFSFCLLRGSLVSPWLIVSVVLSLLNQNKSSGR